MVSGSTLQLQQVGDLQSLVDLHPEVVHLQLLLLGFIILTLRIMILIKTPTDFQNLLVSA